MKVTLIGGSGFIGTNVAIALKRNGYDVLVLDRLETRNAMLEKLDIAYQQCDYVNGKGFENVFQKGDYIIHLVSTSLPNFSNENVYKDATENVLPSINLMNLCIQNGVEKIIYASSGGQVYGIPKKIPISENHVLEPQSAYGIHKMAVEKYLQLYSKLHGIKTNILRISNPYGAGQQPFRGQGVISTFLASALLEKDVEIWGDGTAIRDYIYIDDLAEAFVKTVQYDGEEQVFNVGSGIGTSVNDIFEQIEIVTQKHIHKNYIDAKSADVNANVLDCSKAESVLKWKAKTTLYDGLKKMAGCWNEEQQQFVV